MILKSYPRWFKHFKSGAQLFYSVTLLEQHLGRNLPHPFLLRHVSSLWSVTGTLAWGRLTKVCRHFRNTLRRGRFQSTTDSDLVWKRNLMPSNVNWWTVGTFFLKVTYSPVHEKCAKSRCIMTQPPSAPHVDYYSLMHLLHFESILSDCIALCKRSARSCRRWWKRQERSWAACWYHWRTSLLQDSWKRLRLSSKTPKMNFCPLAGNTGQLKHTWRDVTLQYTKMR